MADPAVAEGKAPVPAGQPSAFSAPEAKEAKDEEESAAMPSEGDQVKTKDGKVSVPVDSRLQHYEVMKPIGKGKFSTVFRAKTQDTGELVALKKIQIFDMMDEKSREKCLKEIRLVQELDHPNIIKYLDSFIEDNQLHLVFEYAEAGDLKRQLRKAREREARFDERVIWKYFSQIAEAIRHMHLRRVMHRDLKPANVFLTLNGTVKVGDLGLGRHFSEATMEAYSKVGTPLYMSPEVLRGKGYEWKSDVWSLGCVLYELAMLTSPFKEEGLNLYGLFQKITKGDYAPVSEVYSEKLRHLAHAMLSTEPEGRPDIDKVCEVASEMRQLTERQRKERIEAQQAAARAQAEAEAAAVTAAETEIARPEAQTESRPEARPEPRESALTIAAPADGEAVPATAPADPRTPVPSREERKDLEEAESKLQEREAPARMPAAGPRGGAEFPKPASRVRGGGGDGGGVRVPRRRRVDGSEDAGATAKQPTAAAVPVRRSDSNGTKATGMMQGEGPGVGAQEPSMPAPIPIKAAPAPLDVTSGQASLMMIMSGMHEKLKLLDYDSDFCQTILDSLPLPSMYFGLAMARNGASGSKDGRSTNFQQFQDFAMLSQWLLSRVGHVLEVGADGLKYQNPATVASAILVAIEKLGGAPAVVLSVSPQQLAKGHGIQVCHVLHWLTELCLQRERWRYLPPEYSAVGDEVEDVAGDEDAEIVADEVAGDGAIDDDVEAGVDEEFAVPLSYHAGVYGVGEPPALRRQAAIEAEVDPVRWREELSRVAGQLRLSARERASNGSSWRGHLTSLGEHSKVLDAAATDKRTSGMEDLQGALRIIASLSTQAKQDLERVSRAEAQAASLSSVQSLRDEYEQLHTQQKELQDVNSELSAAVGDLAAKHRDVVDTLRGVKDEIEERGGNMSNTKPLHRIREALVQIRKETREMTVRLGAARQHMAKHQLRIADEKRSGASNGRRPRNESVATDEDNWSETGESVASIPSN